MRRTGSIIGTLAIALVASVGVVGGGYTLVTGNTLCSIVSACDKPATAAVTPVALNDGKGSTCSYKSAQAVAAADTPACRLNGAKAIAAAYTDCVAASKAAKVVAVADAKACCANKGVQAIAVADIVVDAYTCKADSVLSEEQMTARAELHEMLMPMIQSINELDNGYAIEFPACSKTFVQVAEMVAMSRECCDFLAYSIVADADNGAVRLIMTGDAGGKAFLAKALDPMITQISVANQTCCAKGVKAIQAGLDLPACCLDKAAKVIATRIDINDACCAKGVKAIKAGQNLPACCLDKAAKVIATKVDYSAACCAKGVKAIKAGNDLPQCCKNKAETTDLE